MEVNFSVQQVVGALKLGAGTWSSPGNYVANLSLMILWERTKNPKAEKQRVRLDQVKDERAIRAKEFSQTIEVRP